MTHNVCCTLSPAPCSYDLVAGEDPDEFVSVEIPSLDDEDEGRKLLPVAGRRGGLLRRARKVKKNETASRADEEEYEGDISQVNLHTILMRLSVLLDQIRT